MSVISDIADNAAPANATNSIAFAEITPALETATPASAPPLSAKQLAELPNPAKQLKNKTSVLRAKRKDISPYRRAPIGDPQDTTAKPIRIISEVAFKPTMSSTDTEVGTGDLDGWSSEKTERSFVRRRAHAEMMAVNINTDMSQQSHSQTETTSSTEQPPHNKKRDQFPPNDRVMDTAPVMDTVN